MPRKIQASWPTCVFKFSLSPARLHGFGCVTPGDLVRPDVNVESNSKLYKIIQENEIQVNSIHHQAINKLGQDLEITAKSSDGVIEGIEVTNGWDAVGVQWHPENMLEDNISIKLFEWLNS